MVLMLFAACAKVEEDPGISSQVSLKASIGPVLSSTYTKAGIEGEITSNSNVTPEIGLAKVYGASACFDDAVDYYGAVMSAPSAQNMGLRDISFFEFQGFPDAKTPVNYVGWYPNDEETVYENHTTGKTTVTIPVKQEAYTDILYSNIATGTRAKAFNTMVFSHALVKYTIMAYGMEASGSEGSVEAVWGSPVEIELEQMPEYCVLELPSNAEDVVEVRSTGTQSLIRPAIQGALPVGISKARKLAYFLAPAPEGNVLRIKVTTDKVEKSQTLSIANDFQYGKHYQIYLRFSSHGTINAEVTVGDWQTGEDVSVTSNNGVYFDLSEAHTANSYIISSANRYCFNATVRGNGATGAAGVPGAHTVGEPVSAEIVWTDLVSSTTEDLSTYFSLVSKVEEGRVFFNVKPYNGGMKEGNVVVGVRDKAGNMLWTWHLWLTDRPAEQGYKNGFAVQDRDLGATAYSPEGDSGIINGLYYQWGRPTPLPLDKTVYAPLSTPGPNGEKNEVVNFAYDETSVPAIISRVKSPTTYFKAKATSSEGDLTKNLWGWRSETDEYAKTIYDPCPPGYRVPSIKLWRDLVIVDNKGKHDAHVVSGAAKFYVDVNNTAVYYPMTGYYLSYTGAAATDNPKKNKGAYMWAATFDLTENAPYALGFKLDETESANELNEMKKEPVPSNIAMPVRCISRMSKAHVTNLSDYQTANSYMVHKDGFYKFKATVRGNGIGQLVSPGSTSTIVLTEQLQSVDITNQLVKVEPLWWHSYGADGPDEDDLNAGNHFTMLNEGKPDADGYVSFNVPKWYKGNLILVGRDARGDIIWSWHVWFTESPKMKKSNSFVVMDRNLGATHAPDSPDEPTSESLRNETYGFYYQWGRKDPFLKKTERVYLYNSSKKEYEPSTTAFAEEADVADKTIANAVSNPMTYHLASESGSDYNGVFGSKYLMSSFSVTADNNDSKNQCYSNMMHPESRQSLWGYSAAKGYGVTTTKTMYDPCPPGYLVAHYLVWTNTERIDWWENLYYTNLDGGFKENTLTSKEYGIFLNLGISEDDYRYGLFDEAWYPLSGYLRGDTSGYILMRRGSRSTSLGLFHTSTPAGNGSRSICYDYMNSYSIRSGQAVDGDYEGLPSSFAYPVRCQKE